MGLNNTDFPVRHLFRGNILLIICCVFYLVWWLLAFKPTGAIKGIKTGWLLIPAAIAGLAAVILLVNGILSGSSSAVLFSGKLLLLGGIAAYLILWAVTGLVFKRQVTSELFLIVGWAMLVLSEISVLYGGGSFSLRTAIVFTVVTGVALIISLVCYVLYYRLGVRAGYADGMIPLIVAGLVMAGLNVAMGGAK